MSEYSYKIHKILNNPILTTGFNPALNKDGTRLIIGDGQLPDFSNGITPPANGTFKVYKIKHDPMRHIKQFSQLGPTMVGSDLESLGNNVGMDSTGDLIIASTIRNLFNIYKYNSLSDTWDIIFSPQPGSIMGNDITDFSVGGFRYDSQFRFIITAILYLDINNETATRLICFKRDTPNGFTWSSPDYTNEQNFIDMFLKIRGLSCSDVYAQPDIAGPVIVHAQQGDAQNHITLNIVGLTDTTAITYGNITTYDNSDDYLQISAGINKKANRLVVSYFKDDLVQGQIYKWDTTIGNWVTQHLIRLTPVLPFSFPLSYVYLSDKMKGDMVSKICLSMNYSISADPIYGVYEYNTMTGVYDQKVSFSDKLIAVAGDNPLLMGFLGSYVSDDFNTIATSFVGPDPDPQNGLPFGPANYPTTPAPGISDIGDIMSEGISLALFINSTNSGPAPPPDPTPTPTSSPFGVGTIIAIGAGVTLSILTILFLLILL